MARDVRDGAARLAVLVAIAALALGMAACGDSADGGDANAGGTSAETPEPRGPEAEIRAEYAEFDKAMKAEDAPRACAALTPKAQKLIATGAGKKSCKAMLKGYYSSSDPSKKRAFLVSLEVDGSTARAEAKTSTSKRYPVGFAKYKGEWKLNVQGVGG